MTFSESQLQLLLERSAYVWERLDSRRFSAQTGQSKLATVRLRKWRRKIGCRDIPALKRRLALDNLDITRVRPLLGTVRARGNAPLPNWLQLLAHAVQSVSPASDPLTEPVEPLPFEQIFHPFIRFARQRLLEAAEDAYVLLSSQAHRRLERGLLQLLTQISAEALELKFSLFRHENRLVFVDAQRQHADKRYRQFLQEMHDGGLIRFFCEYCVLARLIALAVGQWIESTSEFLLRLERDWNESVAQVEPDLSDRHHGGRAVIAVTFSSGTKLVYKARPLALDAAYFRLLEWFNENAAPEAFRILKVTDRSDYGWVEYAKREPCANLQAARRYFKRLGMLQCVLYVLDGTDCHMGNLIACGEYPVFIDPETLFQPHVGNYRYSAMYRTSLLPDAGAPYDLSSFGGEGGEETEYRIPQWEGLNTDRASLSYVNARIRAQANTVVLEGAGLRPSEYIEEVLEGFAEMYRFFVNKRSALLSSGSRLRHFANLPNRILYRPTRDYISILNTSVHLRNLRDGADRTIEIDTVVKEPLRSPGAKRFWSVVAAEGSALERLDVPYFAGRTRIDQTVARLTTLSSRRLAREMRVMKVALFQKLFRA